MFTTKEELEDHVCPMLNEGVSFNCHELKMVRHRGNKKLKVFNLEFTWISEGTSFSFGRRVKVEDIASVIDGYIEEVNCLSTVDVESVDASDT